MSAFTRWDEANFESSDCRTGSWMISGRIPVRDVGHSTQLLPASARGVGWVGGGAYYCSYASPKDDIRVTVTGSSQKSASVPKELFISALQTKSCFICCGFPEVNRFWDIGVDSLASRSRSPCLKGLSPGNRHVTERPESEVWISALLSLAPQRFLHRSAPKLALGLVTQGRKPKNSSFFSPARPPPPGSVAGF